MAIYTRNAEGKFVPLNIPTLKGEKGQDGVTPNFTIGTVTTLDPGQQVTVGIRGDKENPILDFGIPRGQDGAGGGANNNYGGGADGGDTLPTVGSTLSLNPSGNYVGKVAVYGGTVALRDLANGSTSGVSRQEFNIHKLENSEQHQNLQNSINTTNNNVSTQSQRITNLENNSVRLNAQNRFTSKNIFENRSPIVDKYFSIKNIATSDGVDEVTYDGQYYCTPSEGIESGRHVHWLLLPIYNSQPGDTVNVSHFIVNAGSKVLVSDVSTSTYTVLDIQYRDHYCVAISINRTFSHSVSFGFRVEERIYPGRRLGLLKQYLPNQNNNNAWCSYNAPSNGQSVGSSNSKFTIPYVFAQKTQSEVVTRFDLANTTFPIDTAHLGELKFLAYDAGESVEINGRIWLKCNGQTLSSAEYGELYNEIGLRFNTKEEVTIRPTSEDGTEVAVEFNLPSNSSYVGYMYICAK